MAIEHEDLTSIHRFAYVSNVDPGAVGAYKAWVDTLTNEIKLRNVSNSGWTTIGSTVTASNVGSGAGVFKQKNGSDLELRKLKVETGGKLTITQNTSDISFSVDTVALIADGFLWGVGGTLATSLLEPIDHEAVKPDGYFYFGSQSTPKGAPAWTYAEPPTITSDKNNYVVGDTSYYIILQSDASRNITGINTSTTAHVLGATHLVINKGANNIVLKHLDGLSASENQFRCSTGADITLSQWQAADIIYNPATAGWLVYKRN